MLATRQLFYNLELSELFSCLIHAWLSTALTPVQLSFFYNYWQIHNSSFVHKFKWKKIEIRNSQIWKNKICEQRGKIEQIIKYVQQSSPIEIIFFHSCDSYSFIGIFLCVLFVYSYRV